MNKKILILLAGFALAILFQGCGDKTSAQNGSSLISVSASPSTSAALGGSITLTAADASGSSNATFSFTSNSVLSGTTINQISPISAVVTSSTSTIVSITVSETSGNNVSASTQISLTFGTGGGSTGTGSVQISASPSPNGAVGSSITLFASSLDGTINPSFTFALTSAQTGVTLQPLSSTTASVMSTIATTVIVTASEFSSTGVLVGSGQITLSFGGSGGGTGSLVCQLTLSAPAFYGSSNGTLIPVYYRGQYISFNVTASGVPLQITQFNSGESSSSTPSFPMYPPIYGYYSFSGYKQVQLWAQSTSGTLCSNNPLQTLIYIWP